jgi:hypothetical protein
MDCYTYIGVHEPNMKKLTKYQSTRDDVKRDDLTGCRENFIMRSSMSYATHPLLCG